MNSILEVAIAAARQAGEFIQSSAQGVGQLEVEQKSRFDYVSKIDRQSETLIKATVAEAFPEHAFLGEEFGAAEAATQSDYQWIVDPLDGTTNFLRSIPHYAVSIAVRYKGDLQVGVVYDPAKDELFYASKGEGAFLNGALLKLPAESQFAGALLATGVPFSGQNLAELDAFTGTMQDLLNQGTSGIRRLGSAALDLAYVAAGRYDGYWEAMLKSWDIAAGVLLVTEAGGRIGDFSGGDAYLNSGDIVAAPNGVFGSILKVTQARYVRNR